MRPLPLAALALLSACGGDGPTTTPAGNAADTNQIERLSSPQEEVDPQAAARLQPLTMQDAEREGLLGAGCTFTAGGRMLLVAAGSDAIVRINGEIRHLVHSGTVGPTGGFFEDRQVSVSVGRVDEDSGEAGPESMRWPARITFTNRRAETDQELGGLWSCGA